MAAQPAGVEVLLELAVSERREHALRARFFLRLDVLAAGVALGGRVDAGADLGEQVQRTPARLDGGSGEAVLADGEGAPRSVPPTRALSEDVGARARRRHPHGEALDLGIPQDDPIAWCECATASTAVVVVSFATDPPDATATLPSTRAARAHTGHHWAITGT